MSKRALKVHSAAVKEMKQDANQLGASRSESFTDDADEALAPPLTREQAQKLRLKLGHSISPWQLWMAQGVAMVLCGCVTWVLTKQFSVALSAFYGGLAVVLPHVLLVRGMTKRVQTVAASALSFLIWESLKVASSVAMLVLAPRAVPHLSWPALLIGMVVCMKVSWVLLLRQRN
jgi:ATP synthase protein I